MNFEFLVLKVGYVTRFFIFYVSKSQKVQKTSILAKTSTFWLPVHDLHGNGRAEEAKNP